MNLSYENSFEIQGGNFKKAGDISVQIKKVLQNLGVPRAILRRVAIAVYESEINIISYANKGIIHIQVSPETVSIEAEDEGPGIENIELAMRAGYSTATDKIREMGFGAGMGIPNIINCSDTFNITSEVNKGTHLTMIIQLTNNQEEKN
ncbi:MAG: ATP-binding protein [Deltaproteobacteria bacterium]|nr:ATP-binding protein [Deltaproteobacteria bacterium]MBN2686859.1 ATP-binding protein [Deltaproteobacteria bacterium]